jgi:hypothetical protein
MKPLPREKTVIIERGEFHHWLSVVVTFITSLKAAPHLYNNSQVKQIYKPMPLK